MALIILLIFLFIFGLIVGSFLNVVIYWLENKKRKGLGGRSFCPHCEKEIKNYDLIPVVSWLILRGKCRHCKKKISVQYPLVELTTGVIFCALGYFFLITLSLSTLGLISFFFWIIFAACLITIFVYDLKHQIIPDEVIYPALVIGLIFVLSISTLTGYQFGLRHLLAGLLAGGSFYFLAAISKGKWMGGGDIKLAAFMGLVLGLKGVTVALYFSFILGSIFGLTLIFLKRKKLASKIAFGPFLVAGTLISLFFGSYLVDVYVRLFL